MANYPRSWIIFDGSFFHITWKCHNDDWLLSSEFAKSLYYRLLLKYKNRYKVQFFSYCFMDNHPHLTGKCESQELLSSLFRTVNSCFAKELNRFIKRKGQVVMDRFKSTVPKTNDDLMKVMIYNDLNPSRSIKGTHAKNFKWSSYHYYAYGKIDPLITEPDCYQALGNTPTERQKHYQKLINDIFENDDRIIMKCPYRHNDRILNFVGDPLWVEKQIKRIRNDALIKRQEWRDRYHQQFNH